MGTRGCTTTLKGKSRRVCLILLVSLDWYRSYTNPVLDYKNYQSLFEHFINISFPISVVTSRCTRRATNFVHSLNQRHISSSLTQSAPLATAIMNPVKTIQITPRRSHERGHADHGWLKTFHTFAFARFGQIWHLSIAPKLTIR